MHNIRKYRILFLFIVAGFIVNFFKIPLLPNVNFILGSIATLTTVQLYGITSGIIACIIINSYIFISFNNFYFINIYIFEVLVVGLLLKCRKENIVLLDTFYWLCIGMPYTYIICNILDFNKILSLSTMLKFCINGIANSIIVNIIITYSSIRKLVLKKNKNKFYFEEMAFNLIVGCMVFSALTISIVSGYNNSYDLFKNMGIILIIILLSFLFSNVLSRIIVNPIYRLSNIALNLPKKIFYQRSVRWPNSIIIELNSFINNLKQMNAVLNENFRQLQYENKRLKQLVYKDNLTGLPNRIMLQDSLNVELNKARRYKNKLAVMFIDLDGFKRINDTLGHSIGDQLLKEFSQRLLNCIGQKDIVSRLGGDEFTVLLPKINNEKEVKYIADKIIKSTKKPCILNGEEFRITSSIGISIFPQNGKTSDVLLKNADIAMYRAKQNGKNTYQFYTSDMNFTTFENLILENKLYNALERKELELYYQPQVDLNTGQIIGMEALIRWINPELGLVSPGKFIPIAEETGLIIPIGEWTLRSACKQNKVWQNMGYEPMRVAVNISACQFQQEGFVEKVGQILNETGLESKWLEIEITESIAIKNVDFTARTLRKFKDMGVKVSIDDFGTGFSSLAYLKNFKIDALKIDYSFVRDIGINSDNESIIKAIIMLAKNLKLNVIAEGVETKEQLSFLRDEECNESQGYLFSKPVPSKDFEKLLVRHNAFGIV
ncbi:putative bifunctional diguanylate cyclase/phosphodiesterase [Tepidibacter formicigenes]|jgi:diguanylate cyclase (GGDEF)-like protein|uniref:Diguanylate cyclase (GGDEF) domain-containing protein n=1 Tax=Tepidibacter formicigenes DSM 15518 TaxID=1123349 RepID=A0A1M6ML42_9FIRM|nr:EAL domain-containing protein [Tepidibacter formicigenes]SHJ84215.1 diguanylate cyclase (GGDEF) domain-containing protein [Tepidibacter formicigenes DSM 15518]